MLRAGGLTCPAGGEKWMRRTGPCPVAVLVTRPLLVSHRSRVPAEDRPAARLTSDGETRWETKSFEHSQEGARVAATVACNLQQVP